MKRNYFCSKYIKKKFNTIINATSTKHTKQNEFYETCFYNRLGTPLRKLFCVQEQIVHLCFPDWILDNFQPEIIITDYYNKSLGRI